MMIRRILAVLLTLAVAACSSVSIDDARNLSQTGTKASATFLATAQSSHTQFIDAARLVGLRKAMAGGEGSPSDPSAIKDIDLKLESRAAVANQLVKVYSAFGRLAAYDASSEVETALNGAINSTNTFGQLLAIAPTPPIAGDVIGESGSFLTDEALKRKLKRASILIRERVLAPYASLLEKEIQANQSVRENYIRVVYATGETMWISQVMSARPLLQSVAGRLGYTVVELGDPKTMTAANPALREAVIADLKLQRDLAIEDNAKSYGTAIELVQELISAHKRFEDGHPISSATIETLLFLLTRATSRLDAFLAKEAIK